MGEPQKTTPPAACPVCPQCGGDTRPYAIKVGYQTRVLTCRCLICGHIWDIDEFDPGLEDWLPDEH